VEIFAFITVLIAWGSLFLRKGKLVQLLLFMVFLALGTLFALAGGFSYWWDSGMRPDKASPMLLICGVLILCSQAGLLLRAVLDGQGGSSWPGPR
jgi:hypothetical protein